MRLPRDLSGIELAKLLASCGYEVTRQTGSHMRLTAKFKGAEHHLTIPAHKPLKIGTLSAILGDVAAYLEITKDRLATRLFGE